MDYTKLSELKTEIVHERASLHVQLRNKYGYMFRGMDICLALLILFNIGALILTNALVYKEEPATVVYEVNPIASATHGYEEHPESSSLYISFIKQGLMYILLIVSYFFVRMASYTKTILIFSLAIMFGAALISGIDFFNDFGYFMGKTIWGH